MVRVYLEKWNDIISFGYYKEETDISLDLGKYRIYLSKEGKKGMAQLEAATKLIYEVKTPL